MAWLATICCGLSLRGFHPQQARGPLVDVQLAMAMVSADEPTASHPAKALRVAEVKKGWEAAARNVGANVVPTTLTVPERATFAPAAPRTEQRAALLIGNTHYKLWGTPLKNPKNDVIAVGRQLRSLGFSTTVIYDGNSEQIATAIQAFRDEAAAADWALIYYAGTGIEVDGVNYMIPIEADARRALSFTNEYPQMRLTTAFGAVKGAKRLRLVLADACRIDPAIVMRATAPAKSHQFKVTEPPHGVIVVYSTAAGRYAQDGEGELSPFAQALIESLREPGIELPKVFRRVSAQVAESSHEAQVPDA